MRRREHRHIHTLTEHHRAITADVQVAHAGSPGQVRAAERLLEETRRRLYQILADDLGAEQDDDQDEE